MGTSSSRMARNLRWVVLPAPDKATVQTTPILYTGILSEWVVYA